MNETNPIPVYVVDDDESFRSSVSYLLELNGFAPCQYESGEQFLDNLPASYEGCALIDLRMAGMSGLELQGKLKDENVRLSLIFISGHGDIQSAVLAVKRGAFDFIEKPFANDDLIKLIKSAINGSSAKLRALSPREAEVFELVVEGLVSKTIAERLNISERTVEFHRSNMMKKLGAFTLADLIVISKGD